MSLAGAYGARGLDVRGATNVLSGCLAEPRSESQHGNERASWTADDYAGKWAAEQLVSVLVTVNVTRASG